VEGMGREGGKEGRTDLVPHPDAQGAAGAAFAHNDRHLEREGGREGGKEG